MELFLAWAFMVLVIAAPLGFLVYKCFTNDEVWHCTRFVGTCLLGATVFSVGLTWALYVIFGVY